MDGLRFGYDMADIMVHNYNKKGKNAKRERKLGARDDDRIEILSKYYYNNNMIGIRNVAGRP